MQTFATQLRHSREHLAHEGRAVVAAGRRLGEAVKDEAVAWRDFLRSRAEKAVTDARRAPVKVEEDVLSRVDGTLGKLNGLLTERLNALRTMPTGAAEPFEGYADLAAKDIVAKLEKLEAAAVQAVLEFERANKRRATILRAAKQRLSASAQGSRAKAA